MGSITVDDNGTQISFMDSGAPNQSTSYVTIVAVHGMGFTHAIFKKVQAIAYKAGLRFVSIVRRGYPGSTPFSEAEAVDLATRSEDEKAAFLNARGVEFATFLDKLIQQLGLCPITDDGRGGGIALLGWSAGNTLTITALASLDELSFESQERFASYIRALIMEDPPSVSLGLPIPPNSWSPLIDQSLPEHARTQFYMGWITSYFDHGDLSSGNVEAISYYVPSLRRSPSIYNMSEEETEEMAIGDVIWPEISIMREMLSHCNAAYRKVCFEDTIHKLVPKMKTTVIVGGSTCSFCLDAMLSLQEDNVKYGGAIRFDVIPDVNHFMHWDDPEKAFEAYMDAIMR